MSNGLLIRPGDGGELLAAIERIAREEGLYWRLAAGARRSAALYTEEKHGAAMVAVLREAAGI